ncbi:hypothetical protein JCM25156A_26380 [Komagataeibacter kakiaceti JCM 25156]
MACHNQAIGTHMQHAALHGDMPGASGIEHMPAYDKITHVVPALYLLPIRSFMTPMAHSVQSETGAGA